MSDEACPNCGYQVAFKRVCQTGACPDCETPLGELHAIAAGGGVE